MAIQVQVRKYKAKKAFVQKQEVQKHAATKIQGAFRCRSRQRDYLATISSVVILQSLARAYLVRQGFSIIKRAKEEEKMLRSIQQQAAIIIQSNCRRFMAEDHFIKQLEAAYAIQRAFREYFDIDTTVQSLQVHRADDMDVVHGRQEKK